MATRRDMKYILLMSGTKAGVDRYHPWSQKDIEMYVAVLRGITNDLTGSREFVATQGLAEPAEAKVVRGQKNGMPVTGGIFPESKEFLLGYWIVDGATPERAYAIAGRISAASGPTWRSLQTCRLKSGGSRFMSNLSPNDGMPRMRRALRQTCEGAEAAPNEIKGEWEQ